LLGEQRRPRWSRPASCPGPEQGSLTANWVTRSWSNFLHRGRSFEDACGTARRASEADASRPAAGISPRRSGSAVCLRFERRIHGQFRSMASEWAAPRRRPTLGLEIAGGNIPCSDPEPFRADFRTGCLAAGAARRVGTYWCPSAIRVGAQLITTQPIGRQLAAGPADQVRTVAVGIGSGAPECLKPPRYGPSARGALTRGRASRGPMRWLRRVSASVPQRMAGLHPPGACGSTGGSACASPSGTRFEGDRAAAWDDRGELHRFSRWRHQAWSCWRLNLKPNLCSRRDQPTAFIEDRVDEFLHTSRVMFSAYYRLEQSCFRMRPDYAALLQSSHRALARIMM